MIFAKNGIFYDSMDENTLEEAGNGRINQSGVQFRSCSSGLKQKTTNAILTRKILIDMRSRRIYPRSSASRTLASRSLLEKGF